MSRKRRIKCLKQTVNNPLKKELSKENFIDSKVSLPFYLSIQRLTNNRNAIQSTSGKKSIDFDSPNPNIHKTPRSAPIDNNANLLIFNQPNSFHLKNHSNDNTEELISHSDQISISSINSLNLSETLSNIPLTPQQIQTSDHEGFTIHKNSISSFQPDLSTVILPRFVDKPILSNRSISNPRISLSQMENSLSSHSTSLKLLHDKNIPVELSTNTSSFEIPSQVKTRHEIKHETESLWKTKLTLKTLLSMANRDEAQALKDRKPIDYHMFLSNKLNKNSIFQYNDHIDSKFTANNKQTIIKQFNEQDYKENRKLYKRLLNTMGLCKPINTKKPESMMSIKQIKTKRKIKTIPSTIIEENTFSSSDLKPNEPVLITYQAIPISIFNK